MCLGVLGSVVRTYEAGGAPMAEVDAPGGIRPACLLYCPEAVAGDAVLMHMGFVLEVLDPERAADAAALRDGISSALGRRNAGGAPGSGTLPGGSAQASCDVRAAAR